MSRTACQYVSSVIPDTVTCGLGHDRVFGATSENIIAADCEEVSVKLP